MMTNIASPDSRRTQSPARLALWTAMVLAGTVLAAAAQEAFKTADQAADALARAARSGDRNAVLTILGKDAADIVSSGDLVADSATRQAFLAAYDERHHIDTESDNKAVMIVGHDDFPFPIPIVRNGEGWRFDTAAGRLEILYRRIGRNEIDAIQACLAYVDAQNDYADKDHGAGRGAYAQHIVSQPGTQDGLYWPAKTGEEESPLGALVAVATAEGYKVGGARAPFHGYYYKILTRQGSNAPGGALDYVVNGKMIGGFALVAYPAEYGNSGVMTFLVNHAGAVFQKDLGPDTARIAERITSFNPDQTWKVIDIASMQ